MGKMGDVADRGKGKKAETEKDERKEERKKERKRE